MDHRPSAETSGAVPHFYGREKELAWLYGLLDDVGRRRVPCLAVIVAESGIGKSALVQALYRKLTTDPRWDGPGSDGFWPDAFQGSGDDLKVNPDFPEDYRPGTLPKFMWLGIRWQNLGNRNRDDQSCPLPGAREVLYRHVKVVEGMPGPWSRFRDRLKRKGAELGEIGVEEAAILVGEEVTGVAFGPLAPFARFVVAAAREARKGKGARHRDLEEAAERSAGDELCEELGWLMGGSERRPTIVWLDDAQWIDKSSIEFLEKLFRRAKSGEWPLLVLATHWEREWNEHRQHGSEGAPSLTRFADSQLDGCPQTEVRVLEKGDRESLRSRLLARLPGLVEDQRELIIRKCDGNFLSLEENIGELLGRERNFENRDRTNPLTQAAMRRIEAWETDRDKRVEQRFQALEGELQDILGWSSRAGTRFVRKMIADFAQERMENDSEGRIFMCFDPYAILSESEDRSVAEFRDRAYYRSAMRYFEEYLETEDEDDLREFLVRRFSDWINNRFDEDGDTLRLEDAPDSSLSATAAEANRVDLLEMAVRFLPLRDAPDWSEPIAAACLRARCMLVEVYAQKRLWDQCRRVARSLEKIDWVSAPITVLGIDRRKDTCSHLVTAGALVAAGRLAESLLADSRERFEEVDTPQSRWDVVVSLDRLGGIEVQRGELDQAHGRFAEALEIHRRLDEELGLPENDTDVTIFLGRLGDIEAQRGELDQAWGRFDEALEIGRRLAEELGTPRSRRDVSVSLGHLGVIEVQRGELDGAWGRFAEALEIHRRLAEELGTPQSRQDVSASLHQLGVIEVQRGELDGAWGRFAEALEIHRRLAEEFGTPQSRQDVSASLGRLGDIEEQRGELDGAWGRFAETLEIGRRFAEALGTPESRRNVYVSLDRLGGIEKQRGELDRAYGRFAEALEISGRLAEEFGTPQSRRDVSASLGRLGDIEEQRGELDRAYGRFAEALEISGRLAEEFGTPQSRRDVSASLGRLGDIEEQRGELDGAWGRFAETLEIRRRLAEQLGTPQSRRDVSVSLHHLGDIEKQRGELDRAYGRFAEALEIRRRLAEELGTPQSRRDVSSSLGVLGFIEEQRGELDRAYGRFAEALEIRRRLAEELGTPQSRRDVCLILDRLGFIEAQRGELDGAWGRYAEALEIRRRLAEELGTPQSRRDVCLILDRLGFIEAQRGELDGAWGRFAEALEIGRRLAEELGTPQSRRDVSVSLHYLGGIEMGRGELDGAYGRYAEALEIRRRLAEELGTPESRRDVAETEGHVKEAKFIAGVNQD